MLVNLLTVSTILVSIGVITDLVLNESRPQREKELIGRLLAGVRSLAPNRLILETLARFNAMFDAIYGEKHLSPRCVSRSLVSSVLAFILSVTLSVLFGYRYSLGSFSDADSVASVFFAIGELAADSPEVALLLGQNLVVDYLSLAQTRILLKSRLCSNLPLLAIAIAIDLVASLAIVLVPLVAEYVAFGDASHRSSSMGESSIGRTLADLGLILEGGIGRKQVLVPLVMSTLFTSALFYLFVASTLTIKIIGHMRIPIEVALAWLFDRQRPTTIVLSLLAALLSIAEALVPTGIESLPTVLRIAPALPYMHHHGLLETRVLDTHARDVLVGAHSLKWGGVDLGDLVEGSASIVDEHGLLVIRGEIAEGGDDTVSISGVLSEVDEDGFTVLGRLEFGDYSRVVVDTANRGSEVTTNVVGQEWDVELRTREVREDEGIRFHRGEVSWYWCCNTIMGRPYLRIFF